MSQQLGRILCGWHSLYFPTEAVPILATFAGPGDSHGICKRCQVKFEAECVVAHASTPAEILRGVARAEVKQ